jgi:N-acyl amino acid synthase of PEP-CTERM/exosortase system
MENLCEISRLVVHTDFRRRSGERVSPLGRLEYFDITALERRTFPLLSLALFLAATAMVVHSGREHVYAMMELRLARLLRRSGLNFQRVGEVIDYHGLRAAYHIHIREAVEGLDSEVFALYRSLSRDLEDCRPLAPPHGIGVTHVR